MRIVLWVIIMLKKKKDDGLNYLIEENQKVYRSAIQKQVRNKQINDAYRLVRNVIILGAIVGSSIYFFSLWYFRHIPVKAQMPFNNSVMNQLIIEKTRPMTYDEVPFEMFSHTALLINLTNGRVLFDHGSLERIYPASVTKIMTVLVGLNNANLDDEFVLRFDADFLWLNQATVAGFVNGETRTLSEVLHGIMLPSGADATWALANHIAGDYESFVSLMNDMARVIGMTNTHFVTATGLHDDDHFTTADDIAKLVKYALENPSFREIFTSIVYELPRPNAAGSFMNSTLLAAPSLAFDGGSIIGGRTGFTTQTGRSLASIARSDDGEEFLLITFGAPDETWTQTAIAIEDARIIYEYFVNRIPQ